MTRSSEWTEFSRSLRQWCYHTTCDGLPNLVHTRKHLVRFLFWLGMFSACLGLGIYVVVQNVTDYYAYEVTTTDRLVAYDRVRFPIVTFCNQNPFAHPRANAHIQRYFYETYKVNVSSYEDVMDLLGAEESAREMSWVLYSLANPTSTNDSERQSIGYSYEDMFLKATFNHEPIDPRAVVKWYFDPVYGNCYRFNLSSMYATRQGYGLYVEAFIGLPYDQHDYIFESTTRGLGIEIKESDSYPFVYKSLLAQSGTNVYNLAKKISIIQPQPYSKCNSIKSSSNKSPIVDEMQRQGIEYDRRLCFNFYFQTWTIRKFGCYNLKYPRVLNDTSPPCTDRTLFKLDVEEWLIDEAAQHCPLDCDLATYEHSYSFTHFPTANWYEDRRVYDRAYLERLFFSGGNRRLLPSYESIESSFVAVYVVFSGIVVEEITEKPTIEFVDLLSNIGGTLGLFIGPSVLTFTELIDILFIWIAIKWRRRRGVASVNLSLDSNDEAVYSISQNSSVNLYSFRFLRE